MVKRNTIRIVFVVLAFSLRPSTGQSQTVVYVDDDAPPGWYDPTHVATIQEGVDLAAPEDTVFVLSGLYVETVTIDKTLSLIGQSNATTIVDGSGVGDVVHVSADWVRISDLAITNSGADSWEGYWDSGIELDHVDHCEVDSCIFRDNEAGLCLYGSSHNTILGCSFSSNHVGIVFTESYARGWEENFDNAIRYNDVYHNTSSGIRFEHTGITYHHSNHIEGNRISHNSVGISMIMSQENEISSNAIFDNSGYGVALSMCMAGGEFNEFHHNQFISNNAGGVQASQYTDGYATNYWYSEWDLEGNYWSDYTGPDDDGDGIGDIPYDIDGGEAQDFFPLMELHLCGNGTCGPDEDPCACARDCVRNPRPETPFAVPKNRYLSFRAATGDGQEAVQVEFLSLPGYEYAEGRIMWVQEPHPVTEDAGSSANWPPPTFWLAELGCTPFYTYWTTYGVVDVYDDAIIPGATFGLRAIHESCDPTNAANYSSALEVSMSAVGDLVGICDVTPCTPPQGVVDFVDVVAVVDKFKNDPSAPRKARSDLINSDISQPRPDQKVDFLDICYCVEAFRSVPRPPPGPPINDPCSGS